MNIHFSKEDILLVNITWQDTQRYSVFLHLLKKCKAKSQWDVISHLSEWLSLKSLQIANVGKKQNPGTLLVGL